MVLTKRLKVLCGIAAAVGVFIVVSAPDPESAAPSAAPSAAAPAKSTAAAGMRRTASPAPAHDGGNLLARFGHRVSAGKFADALFHTQSWYVPPPPPPPAPVVYVPPPPPTAPPLPFTVMGSYAHPGDATVYFLTRGDRVFDVHVGDTIDGIYSVDGAANGQLQLTYKPLNIKQTLALGDSQ
jgi:hypothetical protein